MAVMAGEGRPKLGCCKRITSALASVIIGGSHNDENVWREEVMARFPCARAHRHISMHMHTRTHVFKWLRAHVFR